MQVFCRIDEYGHCSFNFGRQLWWLFCVCYSERNCDNIIHTYCIIYMYMCVYIDVGNRGRGNRVESGERERVTVGRSTWYKILLLFLNSNFSQKVNPPNFKKKRKKKKYIYEFGWLIWEFNFDMHQILSLKWVVYFRPFELYLCNIKLYFRRNL